MSLQIGDIFYSDVAYTEDPSKSSNRPVIVIDELEGNILLLISTTTKERKSPPSYRDQFKIPIQNWRKTGLPNPSWCRGNILIKLPRREAELLVDEKSFIGRMHPEDFNVIIEEVERMNS